MILFAFKFVGCTNALIPVALEAQKDSMATVFYADIEGSVADSFRARYPQSLSPDSVFLTSRYSPEFVIETFKPKLIITSAICLHTSNPTIQLLDEARKRNIPVVAVQDFWGNHGSRKPENYPDHICVQDKLGKELVLRSWPDFSDKVTITGQPAFDYLNKTNCRQTKIKLKEIFGLTENWPIVHLSGSDMGSMPEAISIAVNALNELRRPVYLFLRHHPILLSPTATDRHKNIYNLYKDIPNKLKAGLAVESQSLVASNLVNAAADVVISQYSTMLIEACYMNKPCVAIWTQSTQRDFTQTTKGLLTEFPPCELGACFRATNQSNLKKCLEASLDPRNKILQEVRRNQKERFNSDGQSAKRVYEAIKPYIS